MIENEGLFEEYLEMGTKLLCTIWYFKILQQISCYSNKTVNIIMLSFTELRWVLLSRYLEVALYKLCITRYYIICATLLHITVPDTLGLTVFEQEQTVLHLNNCSLCCG